MLFPNGYAAAFGSLQPYVCAHTAWPGTAGSNEVTTAGAIYARVQGVWTFNTGTKIWAPAPVTINIPDGVTVKWLTTNNASTAGTFYGAYPCGGTGYYYTRSGNSITLLGSGTFADNDVIVFYRGAPTGVTEGEELTVTGWNAGTKTFTLLRSGVAVTLTGNAPDGALVAKLVSRQGVGGTWQLSVNNIQEIMP